MPAQLSTLQRMDATLKDRELIDELIKTLNTVTPFAERITQTITVSGRKAIVPAQFDTNEAVYVRGDGVDFGDAKASQPVLAEVKVTHLYALFEITGPVIAASRDQPGAFVDSLSLAIQNTLEGLKLSLARRYMGRKDAVWALVSAITNNTTFAGANPFGLGTEGGMVGRGRTKYKGNQPLNILARVNMAIDLLDSDTPTTKWGSNETIASATDGPSSTTINVSPDTFDNVNLAVGDYVVIAGDFDEDIGGFLEATSDAGTYLNIARSGRLGWQGVVVDAAGGATAAVPLDPNDLRDIVDLIVRNSGQEPKFMVGSYKMRRNIYNLVAPQITYAPFNVATGLRSAQPEDTTVIFDGMPFVVERFFPPQHIGFVNPAYWYHVLSKDVEWIEAGNGTVLHWLQTADKFRAALRTYRNLACLFPATQGLLFGIEE